MKGPADSNHRGTIRDMNELHPAFKARVDLWLADVHAAGHEILIVETRRTMDVAEAYYAQSREPNETVNILRAHAGLPLLKLQTDRYAKITDAMPGLSWHIYGLAVDFVPMSNGKCLWSYSENSVEYAEIAKLAEKHGLQWGGEWRSFKDYPHIEYHPNLRVTDALVQYHLNQQSLSQRPWMLTRVAA